MKITDKQKQFILKNIDVLNNYELQEIIETLIDNMSKEYAKNLIAEMIENLNECDFVEPESLDYGDR